MSGTGRSVTIRSTKSEHLFQRAKREKNTSPRFWTRGMVPAERIEVLAAWEAVEPRVKHNSCDTLKEWARSISLIMFLDGTGGPVSTDPELRRRGWCVAVLDFTDVFCAVLGLRRRRRSPWRQAHCPQTRGLRWDSGTPLRTGQDPLVLVSDNEHFVSTVQRVRANRVGQCGDRWHQYWVAVEYHAAAIPVLKVKSHASEWPLWPGHLMFADRLAAKGAEAHQPSEWTQGNCRSQEFSHDAQRCVATLTLHIAEQYHPTSPFRCPMLQSLGSVHRWKNASGCPSMR